MCVSCQKSAALASEGAASQRAGTALRRGENTNKLSYFSTLVAKRRWASFSLTMGTSIAGSLGRHAGKLPNHAGRGHRRPHHYHPHPIAQFPVHCVEPGRGVCAGGSGRRFRASFLGRPITQWRTPPPRIHRLSGCGLISGWAHPVLPGKRPLCRREGRLPAAQTAQCRRSHRRTECLSGRRAARLHRLVTRPSPDLDRPAVV